MNPFVIIAAGILGIVALLFSRQSQGASIDNTYPEEVFSIGDEYAIEEWFIGDNFVLDDAIDETRTAAPYNDDEMIFDFSIFGDIENAFVPVSVMGRSDMSEQNVSAFLALIRYAESKDRYDIIAGGDTFDDFSDHPFNINPSRNRPLGTTASGAYQIIRGTWNEGVLNLSRKGISIPDFSPQSQDLLTVEYILKVKRKSAYPKIVAGDFVGALTALRKEWEVFDKMLAGTYPITVENATAYYASMGGILGTGGTYV